MYKRQGMGRAAPGSQAYAGSKTHLLPCGVAYDRLLGGFKGASRRVYLGGTRDVAAGICPAVGFPRVLRGVYEVKDRYSVVAVFLNQNGGSLMECINHDW